MVCGGSNAGLVIGKAVLKSDVLALVAQWLNEVFITSLAQKDDAEQSD